MNREEKSIEKNKYFDKYLKYKTKYVELKKLSNQFKINKKDNYFLNMSGGLISSNEILKKIKSIGFEFETDKMSPFTKIIDYKTEDYNNAKQFGKIEPPDMSKEEYFEKKYGNSVNEYESLVIDKIGIEPIILSETSDEIFKVISDTPSGFSSVYNLNYFLDKLNIYSDILEKDKEILYYLDNQKPFVHTEFHFTFKRVEQTDNLIYKYLAKSVQMLENYFDSLEVITDIKIKNIVPNYIRRFAHLKIQYDDFLKKKELNIPDTLPNILTNKAILYKSRDEKQIYIIPNRKDNENTIKSIDWVIQMTIGVLMEDLVDLVNYLAYSDDEKSTIDKNWKNALMNSQYMVNEFLCKEKIMGKNYTNKNIKQLLGFITILIYETSLGKDNNTSYKINKFKLSFGIRHKYNELLNIFKDNQYILKNFFEYLKKLFENGHQFKNFLSIKSFNNNFELFAELYYQIVFNSKSVVIRQDENYQITEMDIENEISKYPLVDDIILIEMRSFYKHLSKNLKKIIDIEHIGIDKVTLEQLDKLVKF